ncbi:unnamed protein product [Oikopleura dioica]|uniref:Glycosyltransferase 2-like domain-containing protein n=1 Tax=Oikopleura dioica TaxID=34765 RepID=E4Y5I0_OIKDI|nr:unnamed protein product [Oikopleura dioica]
MKSKHSIISLFRKAIPYFLSFLCGCFLTSQISEYRRPKLSRLRLENKQIIFDEGNVLDRTRLATKRVNTDHPFKAWDLQLPPFYEKAADVYSQFNCSCENPSKNNFPIPSQELVHRRKSDLLRFVKSNYFLQAKMPLILQKPNQPLEYVSSGYEIEPDEEFTPYLRTYCGSESTVTVKLESFFGAFYFGTDRKNAASTVIKTESSDKNLNLLLASLRYTTFIFDGVNMQDYVQITVICNHSTQHKAFFPVLIRRRPAPQLFLSKSESVNDKLTIVTKTYLRYPCLNTLLDSVFEKYPGITVIVADDSPSSEFQEIDKTKYPTVKHYKLPESEGWFAGRGLAISQVRTKYFLWVDDDFIFNSHTDLEYMINVADKSGYDIVGGGVSSDKRNVWAERDHFVVERDSEGFCYHRVRFSNEIKLPGFEDECLVVDVLLNFFLGRTATAGRIRMDPNFEHIGHPEYFLDGLGQLRTTWCGKSWIDHYADHGLKTRCAQSEEYKKQRGKSGESRAQIIKKNAENWFYRNYLKCSNDFSISSIMLSDD